MINNKLYLEDIQNTAQKNLPWNDFQNSSILITGASGLLGTYLIDVLMLKNKKENLNCRIIAIGRNIEKAHIIFKEYWDSDYFRFISHDITEPLTKLNLKFCNYIIHLASNTHPKAYSTDPIGTITTNIIGLYNLLNFATLHTPKCFVFASSVEIYGENRGDKELFDESYCGYINSNTLRAGYPESKRCGESLCQAYIKQNNLKIIIPRFARTYGPTMLENDSKALSQFIKSAINQKDIVLKSSGNQYYSYTYVGDAISGLLTAMLKGKNGEAYNIADDSSNIHLKDLAELLANLTKTKILYESPDQVEKDGYSKATKALMDGKKLKKLGWTPQYNIGEGVARTIKILKSKN